MIGYEDAPERSGEIAIMEIFGEYVTATSARVNYGVHPWSDPALVDAFYHDDLPIDATRYHIYALEWTPTQIEVYVDHRHLRTIDQSPAYPMQFMLGIYELPDRAAGSEPAAYPRRFVIDYFRAYQPIGGYPSAAGA
jgi:beta-glucanase (GH16 family)